MRRVQRIDLLVADPQPDSIPGHGGGRRLECGLRHRSSRRGTGDQVTCKLIQLAWGLHRRSSAVALRSLGGRLCGTGLCFDV
jgi:hypothetical protein